MTREGVTDTERAVLWSRGEAKAPAKADAPPFYPPRSRRTRKKTGFWAKWLK
ncbi:hypothetical protein [Paenibacillus flagellatus]|uniref:hypothetical protein n=1 Tax=Paenibacillus flagellatus TaxID=2211139 RepID=UPI00130541FB|nr:hypothetical protein [Paenibacillus flagellatus]